MKNALVSIIIIAFALTLSAQAAEISTKISDVHLCCQSCVKGVKKAVADIKDVKADVDQDAETVTLTGSDKAAVQKAADALVAAGYFGKSSNADVKLATDTGAKGTKVQTLKLEGVHLCCGKCVTAVGKALEKVKGVTSNTAEKNAKSFEIKGDFNPKEVFAALNHAGLTGKAAN